MNPTRFFEKTKIEIRISLLVNFINFKKNQNVLIKPDTIPDSQQNTSIFSKLSNQFTQLIRTKEQESTIQRIYYYDTHKYCNNLTSTLINTAPGSLHSQSIRQFHLRKSSWLTRFSTFQNSIYKVTLAKNKPKRNEFFLSLVLW